MFHWYNISFCSKYSKLVALNKRNTVKSRTIYSYVRPQIPLFSFCCSQSRLVAVALGASVFRLDKSRRGKMSTSGDDERLDIHPQAGEDQLDAILKDPRSKAALLKKMGLDETEKNKDQRPTPSGTDMGGWPPYPLVPPGWLGLYPPFPYGPGASCTRPVPTWREGRGTEGQWAGQYDPDDAGRPGPSAGVPGPSSKRPRVDEEDEDAVDLLDETEALELVEFDPKVKPTGTWDPPSVIRSFLHKHFNKSLSEEEREAILKDFPKPNVEAIVTPKLGGDAVEQLRSKGKNPHFGAEKAMYSTQKQLLEVTGPLTCLWADLLNKEANVAPEDVVLLIQRALVLLGSASHSISVERRKLVWAKMNPKLRRLGSEDYNERGTDLFGPGFLEKASKRLEVEKTLAKVTKQAPQSSKRGRFENDNSDLRSFLSKGASVQYGNAKNRPTQPYTFGFGRFQRGRRFHYQQGEPSQRGRSARRPRFQDKPSDQ